MSDKDNYHYFIYKGHIHKIPIKERSESTNEKEISKDSQGKKIKR